MTTKKPDTKVGRPRKVAVPKKPTTVKKEKVVAEEIVSKDKIPMDPGAMMQMVILGQDISMKLKNITIAELQQSIASKNLQLQKEAITLRQKDAEIEGLKYQKMLLEKQHGQDAATQDAKIALKESQKNYQNYMDPIAKKHDINIAEYFVNPIEFTLDHENVI